MVKGVSFIASCSPQHGILAECARFRMIIGCWTGYFLLEFGPRLRENRFMGGEIKLRKSPTSLTSAFSNNDAGEIGINKITGRAFSEYCGLFNIFCINNLRE